MKKLNRTRTRVGFRLVCLLGCLVCLAGQLLAQTYPFQDPNQSLETRVSDLLSRLSQAEKVSLLHQWQPAISRLGVASFRTGTEALHGVAWLGTATVFPQALGLGTTWDRGLLTRVGSAIGDEVRAYHRRTPTRVGLSVWAPVVDLLRDPRAGRTEEGYSEDAYLTGQMSTAFCQGLKGDHAFYYKAIPSLKHFFAYNQEASRDTVSVSLDARNLHEYYLEAFRYAIQSGAAKSLMTAYNLVNGVPCTVAHEINSVVRGQWVPDDFFVVTDAYAPSNLVSPQRYYSTMPQALAGAVKAGVDSFTDDGENTTPTITDLNTALSQGLLAAADLDRAVANILRVRFHTGEFDGSRDPYANLGDSEIGHSDHAAVAYEAVRKSIVLLKNSNATLPLNRGNVQNIAVIGQRANEVLLDWYSGTPPYTVTPLAGIRNRAGSGVTVNYAANNTNNAAVNIAAGADAAIVFVGNHPTCSGGWGSGCTLASEGKETVDRKSIDLEAADLALIQQVYAANPKTIVVLLASFPYAIGWVKDNIPAIVTLAHGGQELGNGLADVLFGDYCPAGRLSMTWYSSLSQLPALNNYDIIGGNRTYMYFTGTPLFPFGYGLSYTSFTYSNLRLSASSVPATGQVTVSVDVRNSGAMAGDEVVQLYVKDQAASVKRPAKELLGFSRVNIGAGATVAVSFTLPVSELAFWDTSRNAFYVEAGSFDIMVGASSADIRLTTTLTVSGGTAPTPTRTRTTTPAVTGLLGDVNGDGSITIIDALMTAQYYVGLAPAGFTAGRADVNGDGSITIIDALMIAQYYVGLIVGF